MYPLVRVAVADLTDRMTEYVVLHVLMHHRRELYLRNSQREKTLGAEVFSGRQVRSRSASWGLGTLGRALRRDVLKRIGFRVAGWSRGRKEVNGVACFHGKAQARSVPCGQTDILVCLLAADGGYAEESSTAILFAKAEPKTARSAPPVVINAGPRRPLQNEEGHPQLSR